MSSENVLIPFKFPYYWSIIFGTMPTRLKLQRSEEHQQVSNDTYMPMSKGFWTRILRITTEKKHQISPLTLEVAEI